MATSTWLCKEREDWRNSNGEPRQFNGSRQLDYVTGTCYGYYIALAACMHFLCPLRKFSIYDMTVYFLSLFRLTTPQPRLLTVRWRGQWLTSTVTPWDLHSLSSQTLRYVCLSWWSKVSPVLKWVWTVGSFPCQPENEAMKEIVVSFPGSSNEAWEWDWWIC